eukprot:3416716-Rhodomonas_salina.1
MDWYREVSTGDHIDWVLSYTTDASTSGHCTVRTSLRLAPAYAMPEPYSAGRYTAKSNRSTRSRGLGGAPCTQSVPDIAEHACRPIAVLTVTERASGRAL